MKKQLTMRELSKATGHTRPYLRQQLRKFDIAKEKKNPGLLPYGWELIENVLVKSAKEQAVICEIIKLRNAGLGTKAIAKELNQCVPSHLIEPPFDGVNPS